MTRTRPILARATLVAALLGAAVARDAHATPLVEQLKGTVRGGVATDGWAAQSDTDSFTQGGAFQIALPKGATIKRAILVSSVFAGVGDVAVVPTNPGKPREVHVGKDADSPSPTGATARVVLEGAPAAGVTQHRHVGPNGPLTYFTFVADVTSAVREVVGAAAPGGVTSVPVSERGDAGSFVSPPELTGHTLAVVYEWDRAPLRNVAVYAGAAGRGESSAIAFDSKMAGGALCAASPDFADPIVGAVSIGWEYTAACDPSEGQLSVLVGGTLVSSAAGGADDGTAAAPACPTAALYTAGSFGATAGGTVTGVKGDLVAPGAPASEGDEVYDLRAAIAPGATGTTLTFTNPANDDDQIVSAFVVQGPAALVVGDADGDGLADALESGAGAQCKDSDDDGVADHLDADSDNDCIADGDPREAGAARLDASLPAGAHCVGTTPLCVPRLGVGVCVACDGDFGARTAAACPSAAAPRCVTAGEGRGACVQGDSDGDGVPDALEREVGASPERSDSDGDGIDDATEMTPEDGGDLAAVDSDGDGVPDVIDTDSDGDGLDDVVEGLRDSDNDGVRDFRDDDDDGDGILTRDERDDGARFGADVDGDGLPNERDGDSDGDGVSDREEGRGDSDGDGRPDYLDPRVVGSGASGDGGLTSASGARLEGGGVGCALVGAPQSSALGAIAVVAAATLGARRRRRGSGL